MNTEALRAEISTDHLSHQPTKNSDSQGTSTSRVDIPLKPSKSEPPSPSLSPTTLNFMVDKATGLMQNIVSNLLTSEVIRKMPSDEYLKLLHLLKDNADILNNRV